MRWVVCRHTFLAHDYWLDITQARLRGTPGNMTKYHASLSAKKVVIHR
jgi:hypothetical protein